jgi:hypothetical protein
MSWHSDPQRCDPASGVDRCGGGSGSRPPHFELIMTRRANSGTLRSTLLKRPKGGGCRARPGLGSMGAPPQRVGGKEAMHSPNRGHRRAERLLGAPA